MFPTDNLQDQGMSAPPADSQELSNEELLALVQKPIENVITTKVDQEVDFEKQWQYMRLRKADLYYRGLQMLAPTMTSEGTLDWSSAGTPMMNSSSNDPQGLLDYNIDIVHNFGKKYTATLGMRPFYKVTAVADDPQSEIDRKAARQAQLCAGWLQNKWNIRVKNIELFSMQYRAGTVYTYTPYVADKELFGEYEEPKLVQKLVVDPATGQQVPVPELQFEKYPGSGPALYLCSGYTVTAPFYAKEFKKLPYLLYEFEENQGVLLQMYGDSLRKRMNKGGDLSAGDAGATHQQGKLTRQSAASLTGMYRQSSESTWSHARYWLATSMYEFVDDENIRKVLYEKFPEGLKVSRVEGVVVKLENEALADVWGCILPEPGETIYADPICWGILGHQDIVNDLINIKVAKEERGLPSAIADADLIDTEALSSRQYLPKEIIPAKAGYGGSLRDAITVLPTPNSDDGSGNALLEIVNQNVQQYTGMLPAVWGAGSAQQTAEGQRMELSQGLMQLGVPGEMASQAYIEVFTRGCKLIAKYAPKGFIIPVPDDKQGVTSEMLDLEALRAGRYHFEANPGMPMSFAEKREQLNAIITENPQLAQDMGLHAPLSAAALRDFLLPDMPEIHTPLEDVRDKVIERIQTLLQQAPVPAPPPPIDPMTGMPLGPPQPPQPSITYEPYVDDPAQHAEIVKEWLNSPPGRKANDPSDPKKSAGYANVVAYGLQCATKAVPQPPPPAPPQPPKVSISLKGDDLGPQAVSAVLGMPVAPVPEPMPGPPGGPAPTQGGPPAPPQQAPRPQGPPPGAPMPNMGMPAPQVAGRPIIPNQRGNAGPLPPVNPVPLQQ